VAVSSVPGTVGAVDERTFRAEIVVGHKQTRVVIVPFDPAEAWPDLAPVALTLADDPRGGRGWPVSGTVAGRLFVGFVGRRYGRSYVVLPIELRRGLADGTEVEVTITPRR
jgi:hypothetical protein